MQTFLQKCCSSQSTPLISTSQRMMGTIQHEMFGTDNPAYSRKYHKGLYHGKTHGQRRQRCFSMKYSLITMKPNTMKKAL